MADELCVLVFSNDCYADPYTAIMDGKIWGMKMIQENREKKIVFLGFM